MNYQCAFCDKQISIGPYVSIVRILDERGIPMTYHPHCYTAKLTGQADGKPLSSVHKTD